MADWPLVEGQLSSTIGVAGSGTGLTVVAIGSPVNTKGSWVELIAATTHDVSAVVVLAQSTCAAGTLVDIGVGADPDEEVLIPDICLYDYASVLMPIFPVSIPAGTRLSARAQGAGAGNPAVGLALLAQGYLPSQPLGRVTAYGINAAASSGTAVVSGVANTEGSWTELVAATANPMQHLTVIAQGYAWNQYSAKFLVDIGIGATPAAVISNIFLGGQAAQQSAARPGACLSIPFHAPAGVRITARLQSEYASKTLYVAAYGTD